MRMDINDIGKIQSLVGKVTASNLKYVDCYVTDDFGIFIPSVGFCEYAITPQHTHPAYSFILFFSETQNIVPIEIDTIPGHYLVTGMSPDIPHEEGESDNFTRYIAILISREFYEANYSHYSCNQPERYFWNQFMVEHDIMGCLKRFIAECDNKLPGYEKVLEALAGIITHQLIRALLKINGSSHLISERFELENVIEYMHQNFAEKLTVGKLARMVNMSESHFIRVFKKETTLSPMEFLIKMRIDKAKKLLRSGSKKITEISLQCGFNSTSHFSTCFAKHLGITPSEYQNSYAD